MSRNRHNTAPSNYWPASQAYILATITLLVGIAAGYLFRASGSESVGATSSFTPSSASLPASGTTPAFEDSVVRPLLRQLQSRPADSVLLAQIGNAYYDGQQYQQAIDYYQRALKIRPDDVDVRTDMGTAMWYTGDADGALQQFEQSLQFQPNHPQTLFNMGVVKWQSKHDSAGAIQAWEKLLAANPNYSDREKVLGLMQKVKSGAGS